MFWDKYLEIFWRISRYFAFLGEFRGISRKYLKYQKPCILYFLLFKQACFCLTVGRFEKKQWVLSSNKNVQEYHIFYIHRGQFVISSIKTGARLEKNWSMQAVGGSTKQKTVMIIKGIVKSSRLPAKIAASRRPATLLSISLQMGFFNYNIPGLAAYFDNSAVYFKTFWHPWIMLMLALSFPWELLILCVF